MICKNIKLCKTYYCKSTFCYSLHAEISFLIPSINTIINFTNLSHNFTEDKGLKEIKACKTKNLHVVVIILSKK